MQAKLIPDANPYEADNSSPAVEPNPYGPRPQSQQFYRESFAAEPNPLLQRKAALHCRTLFATLLLAAGIATGIVFLIQESQIGAVIGVMAGGYVLYLLFGLCCNDLLTYLKNIKHGLNFQQQYQKVRGLVGYFKFNVQCYHYETRHHTRHVTDANGNHKTQHYTTTEKVVTHRNTQTLFPTKTDDTSGNAAQISASTTIVFINFIIKHVFASPQSSQAFDYYFMTFKRNNTFDAHQDFSYGYFVDGLDSKQAFYVGELKQDYSCRLVVFALFGLLWPYSLYVEKKIKRFQLQFTKVLTIV